eukprot:2854983-Rhodomonas_salina.8
MVTSVGCNLSHFPIPELSQLTNLPVPLQKNTASHLYVRASDVSSSCDSSSTLKRCPSTLVEQKQSSSFENALTSSILTSSVRRQPVLQEREQDGAAALGPLCDVRY